MECHKGFEHCQFDDTSLDLNHPTVKSTSYIHGNPPGELIALKLPSSEIDRLRGRLMTFMVL